MNKSPNKYWMAYIILFILIGLRIIAFFNTGSRLWAFNHNIFLSDATNMVFAIIAISILILPFLKSVSIFTNSLSRGFNGLFFEYKYSIWARLIFITLLSFLFAIFAGSTHFLGDGLILIGNLASTTGTLYKWSEKGIIYILDMVQLLWGEKNDLTALRAYQTISIIAGITTIYFYFLITKIVTENSIKRLLIFSLLLISGTIMLFFGYVESYPLLHTAATGFIYFGFRHLQSRQGLIIAFLFLIFGIFVHLQFAVMIPAYIFLLIRTE
ncbi:MAG: hypothetical protein ABIJ45_08710, partial [Candidatus Zixiibacteriota bacterium]